MAGELLSSKIVIQEEEPRIAALPVVQSAVLGAVGKAVRGTLNTATLVNSFDDYARAFGTYRSGFEMPLALRAFFLQGGRTAWVVRAGSGGTKATATFQDITPINVVTFTAKSEGTWGNAVKIYIKTASSAVSTDFNLEIEVDGFIVERFSNVNNITGTSTTSVTQVVNDLTLGSNYITATFVAAGRPVNVSGTALATGAEPTVVDADLIGDTVSSLTGIRAFDIVDEVTMLICPDGATAGVRNAMTTYAEITRNRQIFCFFDPPAASSASAMVSDVGALTASEQWAIYWPRVKIPNPLNRIYGNVDVITQCPSGFMAGIAARNDAAKREGPFANPANVEDGKLFGVVDLETTEVLREEKRDLVFPKRVNPIVFTPGNGFYADGARTGLGSGNFPSIGERRGVSHIEHLSRLAMLFAKNKANTEALRDRVYTTLVSIINPYVGAGAFASNNASQAYFVDVSDQLNSASVRAAGKLLARVGLATAAPAEFIILSFSQDTRALDEELLSR